MFPVELYEDNERAIAVAENPLRFGKSKDIDVRRRFIRDLVKTKATTFMHVESRRQREIFLRRHCLFCCLKDTGRGSGICVTASDGVCVVRFQGGFLRIHAVRVHVLGVVPMRIAWVEHKRVFNCEVRLV